MNREIFRELTPMLSEGVFFIDARTCAYNFCHFVTNAVLALYLT